MKRILSILFLLFSVAQISVAQIKVKDLPTTISGSTGDFLLKDDVAGIAGSTKKISVAAFKTLYFPNNISGTGTINRIPKWATSSTLSNSLFSDDGTDIFLTGTALIKGSSTSVPGSLKLSSTSSTTTSLSSNSISDGGSFFIDPGNFMYMSYRSSGLTVTDKIQLSAGNITLTGSNHVTVSALDMTVSAPFIYTGSSPTNGYILGTDGSGNASWVNPSSAFGSGTQNYVTKWNNAGGTTIGNSQIFDNATNVGIGTTTTTAKLTIGGGHARYSANYGASFAARSLVDKNYVDSLSAVAAGTVTSVAQSFTGGLISVSGSPITSSGTLALTVAGTSGGVPYFSSSSTWASSAALSASALVIGGGAGAAPATTTTGTGVVTALGVNTGSAGAFVVNGGALGTPSSGTLTNATGLPIGSGVSGLGTGVATFLGTPSSANFASAITDETGTGLVVLNTTPTFTTSIVAPKIIGGTGTTSSVTYQTTSGVGATGADHIFLGGTAGATEIMRLRNNGTVGIGTSSPLGFVGIAGGTNVGCFSLRNDATHAPLVFQTFPSGFVQFQSNSSYNGVNYLYTVDGYSTKIKTMDVFGDITFQTAPTGLAGGTVTYTDAVAIKNGGTLVAFSGLAGGTAVGAALTLKPTTGSATTGADIIFASGTNGSTERMRMLVGGNFGIGTSAPEAILHVVETAITRPGLMIQNTSTHTPFIVQTFASSFVQLHSNSYWDGSAYKYVKTGYASKTILTNSSGDMVFETAPSGSAAGSITFTPRLTILNDGRIGIGTSAPTAKLEIIAGSTTANTAPVEVIAGPYESTIRINTLQNNGDWAVTNSALNQLVIGGPIKDFIADVNNSGTGETDLFTYTTKANTLHNAGDNVHFHCAGTFNDITATAQLQFYFAGTNIGNTGALTIGAAGAWVADIYVTMTAATTARADVNISTPTGSTAVYTAYTALTGLTLSGTNIIKVTGTAGGATGGSSDITATVGKVEFIPAANN